MNLIKNILLLLAVIVPLNAEEECKVMFHGVMRTIPAEFCSKMRMFKPDYKSYFDIEALSYDNRIILDGKLVGQDKKTLAEIFAQQTDSEFRAYCCKDIIDQHQIGGKEIISDIFKDAQLADRNIVIFFDNVDAVANNIIFKRRFEHQDACRIIKHGLDDIKENPKIFVFLATNSACDCTIELTSRAHSIQINELTHTERKDIITHFLLNQNFSTIEESEIAQLCETIKNESPELKELFLPLEEILVETKKEMAKIINDGINADCFTLIKNNTTKIKQFLTHYKNQNKLNIVIKEELVTVEYFLETTERFLLAHTLVMHKKTLDDIVSRTMRFPIHTVKRIIKNILDEALENHGQFSATLISKKINEAHTKAGHLRVPRTYYCEDCGEMQQTLMNWQKNEPYRLSFFLLSGILTTELGIMITKLLINQPAKTSSKPEKTKEESQSEDNTHLS